jgi:hypothetical protein
VNSVIRVFQKIEFFLTTSVRTSNPTFVYSFMRFTFSNCRILLDTSSGGVYDRLYMCISQRMWKYLMNLVSEIRVEL